MLINYVSILIFALITASWASSSDDGEEAAVSFSRIAKSLIEEALITPDISSKLSSSSHTILSSFSSKNEYAMPFYYFAILSSFSSKNEYTRLFYEFAIKNYDFNGLGFDSQDPQYWNAFINYPFREFSRNQPNQAQNIINKLVLPSHSFLSQVMFTFQTADFLDQFIPDIDIYLDKVAYNIFIQEFSQILALEDLSEAEILLKALLRKAKNISFDDPEFKYHHAFIVNAPFLYFKRINLFNPKHFSNICSYISKLAPILYFEIAENSKQLADKILAEVLPSKTDVDITEKTYAKIINEYQESLLQPIDNSYLWDPQQFHTDILEAVQTLINVENPNLPYYTMIIEFITKDSDLAHIFRHYIAQNYCKPSNLHIQPHHQPLFWRSLIFSSFSVFLSIFPQYSSQIIEQIQSLSCLDEFQSLFVYEILDDQLFSAYHFPLISGWGHAFTVDLLLQHRTDISADDVGWALRCAAEGGHISTVDLLLQRRIDITGYKVGWALRYAAKNGHISIVHLILQRRADISADDVGWALRCAAAGGHISTVDLLLQRRTDITAYGAGTALESAAAGGHTSTVDLLLQRRTDISVEDFGRALRNAAGCGHISTFDVLLQRCIDIPAEDVVWALHNAAKVGHRRIMDILLQRRTDIPVEDVASALRYAAKGGHISTIYLLLHSRANVYAAVLISSFKVALILLFIMFLRFMLVQP